MITPFYQIVTNIMIYNSTISCGDYEATNLAFCESSLSNYRYFNFFFSITTFLKVNINLELYHWVFKDKLTMNCITTQFEIYYQQIATVPGFNFIFKGNPRKVTNHSHLTVTTTPPLYHPGGYSSRLYTK